MLAPYASVTLGDPVEGSLVAQSVTLSSEVHLQSFEGDDDPRAGSRSARREGPLPGALPLLLAGVGALALAGGAGGEPGPGIWRDQRQMR